MTEFRKRKCSLQDDLELLEGSFENRFNDARERFFGSFKPIETIKKKPLQTVALSVAAGLIIGLSGKKKRNKQDSGEHGSSRSSTSTGFTSLLFDEVKRIAARRAASYISDMMDQKLSDQ